MFFEWKKNVYKDRHCSVGQQRMNKLQDVWNKTAIKLAQE
jgi:hypothetical protein